MNANNAVTVSEDEVEFSAVRSAGPGGQNVNKVATAIQLRFDIRASSLPEAVKARIRAHPDSRITPGGRIVILDTAPPPDNLLKPFINLHLNYVIPFLGKLIGGQAAVDAYTYLPKSTQAFKTPQELAAIMREAGYENIEFKTFMFGTMAVHSANKPDS